MVEWICNGKGEVEMSELVCVDIGSSDVIAFLAMQIRYIANLHHQKQTGNNQVSADGSLAGSANK